MRIIKLVSLAACFLAANSAIHAAPAELGAFGISNKTDYLLSFAINQNCSSEIGNIEGYDIKSISVSKIIQACSGREICEIMAYNNQNCYGDQVGGVKINFNKNEMQVFSSPNVKDVDIGGSISLYQYNIFFVQNVKSH